MGKVSKNLGKLYNGKMALKRREWRGFKDTMYDFSRWLRCYGTLSKLFLRHPISMTRALFRYRWMSSYLTAAAFIDRHTIGLRGNELRYACEEMWMTVLACIDMVDIILKGDSNVNHSKKAKEFSKKVILFDEMMPIQLMGGFPNLIPLAAQQVPVFIPSEMDQQSSMPYIDAVENYGLPADSCPLPASESGCAIVGDYPRIGSCFISSSMPCDGSLMASTYQERFFNMPTYPLGLPQRFNEDQVQTYAVKDLQKCIKFIEDITGETFDWDAYFEMAKRYNRETKHVLEKWDINKTKFPQICGPALTLYRMCEFQIAGSMHNKFGDHDEKMNKIMMKNYEEDVKKGVVRHKHRAVVWACPAHYYSNFSFWAQNCWDIQVLVDMECMLSYHMYDEKDKEATLIDLARSYERMAMRSHTNGGYANVLDELWKVCKDFDANIVLMYSHVSCKIMAGLQGLFEDQARERGIHLIWIDHDLMDPRTVSRKDMRSKVNRYMSTVMGEEPIDPSLVDFDDEKTW